MKNQVNKATFLTRDAEGKLMKVCDRYEGNIPTSVINHLAEAFVKLDEKGFFYPMDILDAYQDTYLALERKAAELPELKVAKPETYLSNVMRLHVLMLHKREVGTMRGEFEAVKKIFDDLQARQLADGETTLRDVAEMMSFDFERMTQAKARRIIGETLPKLRDEVQRAFVAYILADGNFVEAAHIARISKNRYYHDFPRWAAEFRAACVWYGEDEA